MILLACLIGTIYLSYIHFIFIVFKPEFDVPEKPFVLPFERHPFESFFTVGNANPPPNPHDPDGGNCSPSKRNPTMLAARVYKSAVGSFDI